MAKMVTITLNDTKLQQMRKALREKNPVWIVADGVDYGLYQELGTTKMAAQPFMVPTAEQLWPGFLAAFKNINNVLDAASVVEKTARDFERIAKHRAPWDTGALRNSINAREARPGDRVPRSARQLIVFGKDVRL